MRVEFVLNGRRVAVDVEPSETLLNTLRFKLRVKSVKRGCERGECGSCTILLDGQPVTSCMLLTLQVEGREVTTVEGLEKDDLFRKLVDYFIEEGAIQCGFCTPGILLTAWAGLKQGRFKSVDDVREYVANLCRCTGYVKIINAIYKVATGVAGR